MTTVTYHQQITALLVIDPYNDFISERGKVWDRLRAVAEANSCVPNMLPGGRLVVIQAPPPLFSHRLSVGLTLAASFPSKDPRFRAR
jgi:hypothetical protein